MESNGGAARSAESACLPPLHRLSLGQRGGARCQIIAPQIGDAQVPGDQATSRLVLLELLESLKCEFNGARGVPASESDIRTGSRHPASVFDQAPGFVELRWLHGTAHRSQQWPDGAGAQSALEVLEQPFSGIVLTGEREEPSLPEAEFHP